MGFTLIDGLPRSTSGTSSWPERDNLSGLMRAMNARNLFIQMAKTDPRPS